MNELNPNTNRKKLWFMFFAVILFNIGIFMLNSYIDKKDTRTDKEKQQEAIESLKDSLTDVIK